MRGVFRDAPARLPLGGVTLFVFPVGRAMALPAYQGGQCLRQAAAIWIEEKAAPNHPKQAKQERKVAEACLPPEHSWSWKP